MGGHPKIPIRGNRSHCKRRVRQTLHINYPGYGGGPFQSNSNRYVSPILKSLRLEVRKELHRSVFIYSFIVYKIQWIKRCLRVNVEAGIHTTLHELLILIKYLIPVNDWVMVCQTPQRRNGSLVNGFLMCKPTQMAVAFMPNS